MNQSWPEVNTKGPVRSYFGVLRRGVVSTRGFTIVEALVGGLILLVITGVMFQLLVPSMSLFKSQMAFSQAHQSALTATQKMKRELSNTGLSTLTIRSDNQAFSFVPKDEAAPFNSKGRLRYGRVFMVYFLDSENKLQRKLFPYGSDPVPDVFDGPAPPKLSQTQLSNAITGRNGTERVLASRVSHFHVSDVGVDPVLLEPPIVMELKCTVPISSEDNEEYEVRLEVTPRSTEW